VKSWLMVASSARSRCSDPVLDTACVRMDAAGGLLIAV
jgi:hypothetical protein